MRVADTPAESLLLDLLVGFDEETLGEPVDQVIQAILDHKKSERTTRMRELAERIREGLLKHGDPEFDEYWLLQSQLSGKPRGSSSWRR